MDPLLHHMNQYVTIDEAGFADIRDSFSLLHFDKKDHILRAGDVCPRYFFVLSGCLHMYFIDEHGVSKTVQFALENWWITDLQAFRKNAESTFFIQAVEASDVMYINAGRYAELCQTNLAFANYMREISEIGYGAALKRIRLMFDDSKEEIYTRFKDSFPQFTQRVPQYLLASFLGLTPEYLSKLRAKEVS